MRTAAEYVAAEDFDAARRILDEAYAADPRPELLYSRAQVERIAGNCEDAHRLFEQFAVAASEEDAADARRLSAQCTPATTPEPLVPPAATATEPTPSQAVTAPQPQPASSAKPWSRRPLPAAMMGVGLGTLAAGAGLLGAASVSTPTPGDARNEGDYGDLSTRNRRLRTAGVATTAVGAGLAIGAGVIWAVLARRQRDAQLGATGAVLRF